MSRKRLLATAPTHRRWMGDPLMQCLAPRLRRTFASQTDMPIAELAEELEKAETTSQSHSAVQERSMNISHGQVSASKILTTLYSWPHLEPKRFHYYPSTHLDLPLRRDILHRAIVFEGDNTRQGTASTKYRTEVHGSGRKLRPQKGTGNARLGDRKSPMLRGGGVAHGPHPRDFGTKLPNKIYDLAWRTALSYRYRKGELIIIDDEMRIPRTTGGRLLTNIFEGNQWGKPDKRSLLVTQRINDRLYKGMEEIGEHGLVKDITDVDVKDILETGRIVIEKTALDALFVAHVSDIGNRASLSYALQRVRSKAGLPLLETAEGASVEKTDIVTEKEIEDIRKRALKVML